MATPPTLWDFFQHAVFPRLAVTAVYQDVLSADGQGRYRQGRCPFAPSQEPPPSIYVDAQTLRWSCPAHCHRGGQSVLAYLNGGRFPQPGTGEYRAAVEKAARLAGVPVPAIPDPDPEQPRRLAQRERIACLLEAFFLVAHFALLKEAGPGGVAKAAREFLSDQGFDLSALRELPIGLFVDGRLVGERLEQMGFSAQEIEASQLAADPRLAGRLVGPIRDPEGPIESFWARHPGDRAPRCLFKGKWKESLGFMGIEAAVGPTSRGREHLVIVEQLFDALLLQSRGLPNVAAIGGPAHALTRQRWERLAALGVRRVTMAIAADEKEWDTALATLAATFQTRSGPDVFLLPPGTFPNSRGVGPWVRDHGLEAFRSLLETDAVHVYRYKAATILKQHQAGQPWSNARRRAAWKEAIEYYVSAGKGSIPALNEHFVPAIVDGLGRTWDTFEPCPGTEDESPSREGEEQPQDQVPWVCEDRVSGPALHVVSDTSVDSDDATPSSTPSAAPGSPLTAGTCHVHHCPPTDCFCFD